MSMAKGLAGPAGALRSAAVRAMGWL